MWAELAVSGRWQMAWDGSIRDVRVAEMAVCVNLLSTAVRLIRRRELGRWWVSSRGCHPYDYPIDEAADDDGRSGVVAA